MSGGRVTARVRWWRGAWWVFAQGPGIRTASGRRAKKVGPTEADRAQAEKIAERLRHAGTPTGGALTPLPVDQMLRDWFEAHRATLKKSTRGTTSSLIECHLVPYFGDRDLRDVTRADLLAFATQKVAREGKSPKLVGNVLGILRRVMNLAMQEGLLEKNVASKLGEIVGRLERSHASEVRQVDSWTREEVAAILDLAREKEPRAYPVLHVLLSSGMRRGEALGLQWRDIDWSRHKIHVRRSRVRDRTGTPKSGRARQVDMSRQLEAVLRALQAERRRQRPWRDPDGWLFTSRDGQMPIGETVFKRAWQRLRRHFAQRGIRPLTLHSARHTWATLALRAGKSLRWIAEQLGHSDPAITLRIYAHVLPDEAVDLSFLDFETSCSASNSGATGKAAPLRAIAQRREVSE